MYLYPASRPSERGGGRSPSSCTCAKTQFESKLQCGEVNTADVMALVLINPEYQIVTQ